MDIHKLVGGFRETVRGVGHLHLSLFTGIIGGVKRLKQDIEEISDLGDLGDNVPATLIKSLSSRRGL